MGALFGKAYYKRRGETDPGRRLRVELFGQPLTETVRPPAVCYYQPSEGEELPDDAATQAFSMLNSMSSIASHSSILSSTTVSSAFFPGGRGRSTPAHASLLNLYSSMGAGASSADTAGESHLLSTAFLARSPPGRTLTANTGPTAPTQPTPAAANFPSPATSTYL